MNQVDKLTIIQDDPWLEPYAQDAYDRRERFRKAKAEIENA